MRRRRRFNPEDPLATRPPSSGGAPGGLARGDKLIMGGALGLGVLGAYLFLRKPKPPPPKGGSTSGGGTSAPRSSGGYTPPAPAAAAASSDSSESAPVDPSQMTASFGDTPALPPGTVYDSPPGG